MATERYTAVAIVLHWAIAAAILFQAPVGFLMHERAEDGDVSRALFDVYQLHKSIGLTVLALSLVRLGWRLLNPPPPLPAAMPGWERFVAKATHWAFYALMIGLPLTGWLFVSTGWSVHQDAPLPVQTRWFGLFGVPHLFGLESASADVREEVADKALDFHAALAWTMIGLAGLHVAAALKHHVIDRDATLTHMVPGLRALGQSEPAPKNPVRLAILGGGLAFIAVALATAIFSVAGFVVDQDDRTASSFEVVEQGESPTPALDDAALAPTPSAAPTEAQSIAWQVDRNASSITFGYAYEDETGATRFNGRFTRWRADIRFDPNNLDASSIAVAIDVGSAETGIPAHDSALPTAEWFDAGSHPRAEFRSTRIRARGDGYEARGDLTIRGQTRSVDLPFTLTIDGARATATGQLTIDRRDFDIGENSAGDDLISRDIAITIRVEAQRPS